MRRRVLLALAWLPCVLCAAVWVWSYCGWTSVTYGTRGPGGAGYGLCLDLGGAYVAELGGYVPDGWGLAFGWNNAGITGIEGVGPGARRWVPLRTVSVLDWSRFRMSVVPLWLPTLALAIAPVWLARHPWRRRRRAPGLCPGCGYDLRGTPERCPECGTPREQL
jgi:hypothetical protein